ncbi:MAG: HEPN domain-containing protein [Bacteroidales bacterium]|nr:HEPN domain-containing protein [Bacteroidales bacterium]MCF8455476.1 HEPN domain-containing protein [Bacteroidales bacterium]
MSNSHANYISYRIERSDEIYQDAILLFENKRWRSCINRLYYSSFQLVSALMVKHGIEPKTHDGLKTMFFQHYIKMKQIDIDYGKLYSQLFDWRQESDYAEFVDFKKEDIEPLMIKVKKFNSSLIEIITKE